MAGRRGALQRLLDRVFGRQPGVPPEPPPPPPQPPESIPPGERNRYQEIYNEEVSRRTQRRITEDTGYSRREVLQAQIEVFLSLPGMADEEDNVRYEFWREYLQAMVAGTRDRVAFLYSTGLAPGQNDRFPDFLWAEWRAATGYSRSRK